MVIPAVRIRLRYGRQINLVLGLTRDTHLMQQFIYYYKQLYSRIQNLHQCTRLHTGSSEPQPQHLVLDTIWISIIRIQPNTPEDGHIDARNM